MIPVIGVYLLFAAVVLRGVVVFYDTPYLPVVIAGFLIYGLLLILESWFTRPRLLALPTRESRESPSGRPWKSLLVFVPQATLVVILMAIPETQDFFALLFVPLSMQMVLTFGMKTGFASIALFSILIILLLLRAEDGPLQGATMGVFFSGICFLFGGYAQQVQKAESTRNHNQETFQELQVAHSRLREYAGQLAILAVERERNRLARDLHDSVTQTAFSMNLAAQTAGLVLEKDPSSAAGHLLHLEELAARALAEIQSLVTQLRPRMMSEDDLPVALRRLAAERQEQDGLHITVQISGERILSEMEVAGLYSIAYEALTNVVKHSGVHQAVLRLNLDERFSSLEIEDHGSGFDPRSAAGRRGHIGMTGMFERAGEIGWNLSVQSQPGQGTCIRVTVEKPGDPE